MLGWCIVTLASARLKAFVRFPPLRGMYQRGGTCKGCDIAPAGESKERQSLDSNSHTASGARLRNVPGTSGQGMSTNSVIDNEQGQRLEKFIVNWKQGIFGHRLPIRFKLVSRVWLFMRGVVIWHIWEQRNEAASDGRQWHLAKLYHKLWLSMVDYGRLSWSRAQSKMEKATNNPEKKRKLVNEFRYSWCRKSLFATWVTDHPQWNLVDPRYVFTI